MWIVDKNTIKAIKVSKLMSESKLSVAKFLGIIIIVELLHHNFAIVELLSLKF